MKKELQQIVKIPEGIEVTVDGTTLTFKGPEGKNKRTFNFDNLNFKKKDNQIILENKKATKREKKMMNTNTSHIKNMIKGVQEKFEYKLKICFSHFPFNVDLKGNKAEIKNFLGEKIPRHVSIPEGAEVKIDKQDITITAIDKEIAGQAAANFERATKIRSRDRRVFQDGIFITNKCGREL